MKMWYREFISGPALYAIRQSRKLTSKADVSRLLKEGDIIPKWYGIAYYDMEQTRDGYIALALPIPFNIPVGLGRAIYKTVRGFLKVPPWRMAADIHHQARALERNNRIMTDIRRELREETADTRDLLREFRKLIVANTDILENRLK